jgi:adenine-specific DNA methylase
MIERDFDVAFVADLALREKQIQQHYRPIMAVHKWFARRPGTLFRALLLSEFLKGSLRELFYQGHWLGNVHVLDPFMGEAPR